MSLPIRYTKELIHHDLGYGLYYPDDSHNLRPGNIGYFNDTHNFVVLGKTGWKVEGLSPGLCADFDVKCSKGVEATIIGANVLAK